jgi:hypothetical protein
MYTQSPHLSKPLIKVSVIYFMSLLIEGKSSNTLIQHQKSNKCRLRFAGKLLPFFFKFQQAVRIQIVFSPRGMLSHAPSRLCALCEGLSFPWSLGHPCRTYPLPIHPCCRSKPGFTLLLIEPSNLLIRVRALTCQGFSTHLASPAEMKCLRGGSRPLKITRENPQLI